MRVNPTLKYGSILLLAVILLSLIPAGVVTALSIGSVKPAQASSLTVTPTRIWKNVLKVVVNAPENEPPTVAVKVGGAVKYYLLLGYAGNNQWVGFIALDQARDVAYKSLLTISTWNGYDPSGDINVTGTVTDITGYTPDVDFNITKGLAEPGVIYNKLAIAGSSNVNISNGKVKFVVGVNISRVWPFINVLSTTALGVSIGDTITITYGTEEVSVTYGPSEVSVGSPSKSSVPPEATINVPFTDVKYFTDPTKVDSEYNLIMFSNETVLTIEATTTTNTSWIFNSTYVYGAIKEILSNAGLSSYNISATLSYTAGSVMLTLAPTDSLSSRGVQVFAIVSGYIDNITNYTLSFKYVADLSSTTSVKLNLTCLASVNSNMRINDQFNNKNITVHLTVDLIFLPYTYSVEVGGQSPSSGKLALAPIDVSEDDFGKYTISFKELGDTSTLAVIDATHGMSLDSKVIAAFKSNSSVALLDYAADNITSSVPEIHYESMLCTNLLPGTLVRATITDSIYGSLTGSIPSDNYITTIIEEKTGALSIQPVSSYVGSEIKVTYTDPDANLDPNSKETVTVYVEVPGIGDLTLTAEETGKDTGVFEASITTMLSSTPKIEGDTIYLSPNDVSSGIVINARVLDKYIDTGPKCLKVGDTLSEDLEELLIKGYVVSAPTTVEVQASIMPNDIGVINISTMNLNVLKDDYDYIRLVPAGDGIWKIVWHDDVYVGKLEMYKVNATGTFPYEPNFVNMYIPETSKSSGTFTIKFVATGVNAGDKIVVKYYDEFHEEYVATKEIGVGGVQGKLYVDRNVVNIPVFTSYYDDTGKISAKGGTSQYITVTVYDPDWNKVPGSIDQIPSGYVTVIVYNGTGDEIGSSGLTLIENGTNTGYFKGTIKVEYIGGYIHVYVGSTDVAHETVQAMLGGQIRVVYSDPFGNVMKYIIIQPVSDELSVSKEAVALNEPINITFKAPDMNACVGCSDSLPSGLAFLVTVKFPDGRVYLNKVVRAEDASFKEVEDGVFVWTVTPADLVDKWLGTVTDGDNKPADYAGATVTITYIDPVGAASTLKGIVTHETSVTIKITSHTANVTVLPKVVGPYTWLDVKIKDPDLVGLSPDDIISKLIVSSSETPSDDAEKALNVLKNNGELVLGYNTSEGFYEFMIKLTLYSSDSYTEDINDGLIPVAPHDNVTIIFMDPVDVAGDANKPIITVVPVITETANVTVPRSVSPDSTFTVKVQDIDENLNPDKMDTITAYIWSDAQPTKTKVTLVETDLNSAVFQQKIIVTSDASKIGTPNTVYAPAGSIIYIEVVDPLNSAATEQDMVFKVGVGVAPVTHPVTVNASKAKLVNAITGEEITTVPAGGLVAVNIPMTNTMSTKSVTFVAIPVVYKDGVPVALGGISTVDLPAGTTRTVSISLPVLTEPGTYTVKIFVWNSLTGQTPLTAEPIELTITVTSG